ncbi:hypothetical protein LIER_13064 [Lithospermum erythrorhizon]|uniref:Uncharacterized protein n=1 Tax=Lithospermum erythrorhizon TaxID=34254 RepID=A0AAV3PUG6_LITER
MINGLHSGRKEKNELLSQENEEKSVFGRYSNAEMLVQLKRLAQNPCDAEFSHDKILPLFNQSLFMRRVMALCDTAFPRVSLSYFGKGGVAEAMALWCGVAWRSLSASVMSVAVRYLWRSRGVRLFSLYTVVWQIAMASHH